MPKGHRRKAERVNEKLRDHRIPLGQFYNRVGASPIFRGSPLVPKQQVLKSIINNSQ